MEGQDEIAYREKEVLVRHRGFLRRLLPNALLKSPKEGLGF